MARDIEFNIEDVYTSYKEDNVKINKNLLDETASRANESLIYKFLKCLYNCNFFLYV